MYGASASVQSSGIGPGLTVVVGIGISLAACAVALAVRAFRTPDRDTRNAVTALLGAAGVAAHTLLAVGDPASALGFLLGTTGASGAVLAAARVLDAEPNDGVAQALGVVGLVWIAGSVTVLGATVPGDWPFVLGGVGGVTALSYATLGPRLSRVDRNDRAGFRRRWLALGTAFLAPAAVGTAFGTEVLFVAFLVAVGVLVVCWWLVRAWFARSPW